MCRLSESAAYFSAGCIDNLLLYSSTNHCSRRKNLEGKNSNRRPLPIIGNDLVEGLSHMSVWVLCSICCQDSSHIYNKQVLRQRVQICNAQKLLGQKLKIGTCINVFG